MTDQRMSHIKDNTAAGASQFFPGTSASPKTSVAKKSGIASQTSPAGMNSFEIEKTMDRKINESKLQSLLTRMQSVMSTQIVSNDSKEEIHKLFKEPLTNVPSKIMQEDPSV